MTGPGTQQVPQLLQAWSEDEEEALAKLLPLAYQELHGMARRYMCVERRGHTLLATALVNEACLRLIDVRQVSWQNRNPLFAIAAQLMPRNLMDFARSRGYQKWSSGTHKVSPETVLRDGQQRESR